MPESIPMPVSTLLPGAGVRVGVVALSGYAADPAALAHADALLQSQGCTVRHFGDTGGRHLRFAGTDAARLQSLHKAARDPEIDVIIALRGGYGVSRLLPEIDFALLASSGKLLVGHSDFTALQMALLAHGAGSFAGPMICGDFARPDVSAFTMAHFWDCLRGPRCELVFAATPVPKTTPTLDVQGMLWGGNLAMLAHLSGTQWMPAIDAGILFLEDVNEHPFRIERMLLQLLHAGVLDRQQAILLGDFSGGASVDYDNGYDFAAMLAFIGARTRVPILTGLPFGHIPDKVTLAVGSHARLRCDGTVVRLAMEGYRHLAFTSSRWS